MIALLYMAVVLVIFLTILTVVGIIKSVRTMAIFMDDSFRWGGRDG